MPFTENIFIVFICVFFILYYFIERFSAIAALRFTALASLLFVAFYYPPFAIIPLIQASILVWFSRSIRNARVLWVSALFMLLPLIIFKYTDFALSNVGLIPVGMVLPLGISFYTFTAIGFLVDHYREPFRFTLIGPSRALNFLTFWPHLASGPILRSDSFLFKEITPLNKRDFSTATVLIIFGLYKKLVIADGVAGYVNQNISLGLDGMSFADAAATIVGFSVRIYGDFSGYSDMAIGFAMMMGINIPANFNYPYQADSLTDFWRRWHISLSTWFRDYVYIPLGGNSLSFLPSLLVVIFVFLLSGLWHGAAWSFVVWGGIHGVGLAIERMLRGIIQVPTQLAWVLTFVFVSVAWSFFFLSLDDAITILGALTTFENSKTPYNVFIILFYLFLVLIDLVVKPYIVKNRYVKATRSGVWLMPVYIFICMFFAGKQQPFIYFDF